MKREDCGGWKGEFCLPKRTGGTLIENLSGTSLWTILLRINGSSTPGSKTFGETIRTGVEQGAVEKEHIGRSCAAVWSIILQHGHDMEPSVVKQQHFCTVLVSLARIECAGSKGAIKTTFAEKRANTNVALTYVRRAVII